MSLSRRAFLMAVPAAGAVLAWVPRRGSQRPGGDLALDAAAASATLTSTSTPSAAPVVSFHLDQPYLDLTGLEKPYVPPVGARSGTPLAALSEEQVLSRLYGFI